MLLGIFVWLHHPWLYSIHSLAFPNIPELLKFSCSKYCPDHTVVERLNEVGQAGVGSSVEAAVIIHKMEKRAP